MAYKHSFDIETMHELEKLAPENLCEAERFADAVGQAVVLSDLAFMVKCSRNTIVSFRIEEKEAKFDYLPKPVSFYYFDLCLYGIIGFCWIQNGTEFSEIAKDMLGANRGTVSFDCSSEKFYRLGGSR